MQLSITHEIPMGHRLQRHTGRCRFLHGHNYLITVTVGGIPDPLTGMIIDFSDLKRAVREYFDRWDHAMVLEFGDPVTDLFTRQGMLNTFMRHIEISAAPTAENLALHWKSDLSQILSSFNISYVHLTVKETRDSEVCIDY